MESKMSDNKTSNPKKMVKALYGKMFKFKFVKQGKRWIEETNNIIEALPILKLDKKRRCPFCLSNKCLENTTLVYKEAAGPLFNSDKYPNSRHYDLEIALCNKHPRYFLIEREVGFFFRPKKGICPYCGSPFTERVPDKTKVELPLIVPPEYVDSAEKYGYELFQEEPYKCKKCKRTFGGDFYVSNKI